MTFLFIAHALLDWLYHKSIDLLVLLRKYLIASRMNEISFPALFRYDVNKCVFIYDIHKRCKWVSLSCLVNNPCIKSIASDASNDRYFQCKNGWLQAINTLRPRQNGRRFADNTFKRIFLNENVIILIKISLKFVPKDPIDNIPALVQIMAWRQSGDKPLSEPMMVSLLTHICVTRPQWVNFVPSIAQWTSDDLFFFYTNPFVGLFDKCGKTSNIWHGL